MPIFAFTDIEGSTALWERHQTAMGPIIARHYALLEEGVATFGGRIIKRTGDGIFALFPDGAPGAPSAALACAVELQQRFQNEPWPVIGELRVRMAFHRGEAEEVAGDYYGPTANRTARLMALGWGGQILVSEELRKYAAPPEGAQWLDFGLHQIKDLPEPQRVFGLLHPQLKLKEFPPLKSLSNRPHNLPEQLAPFFGRETELREIAQRLEGRGRLLTLLGGGGMGKSRLAIAFAMEQLGRFRHGVHRVVLESLSSPDGLTDRIADSLKIGLYRSRDVREQLLEYLGDKEILLILDPCERVAVGAGLLSEILEQCPGVRILACSRRRLNVRGETVLAVAGLPSPEKGAAWETEPAARVFAQQVESFQPGFAWKPEDGPAFGKICRALHGMPLGLELAAGWLRSMPLAALAERLEKAPGLLFSPRQDLPKAHRSLKELFESSWILLEENEQNALAELTVFDGGFTQADAQQVLHIPPEVLAALADLCLVDILPEGRYRLQEGNRQFAAQKLDGKPSRKEEALNLHARHFCRIFKERERNLLGPDQARAVAELKRVHRDLLRAWDRACDRAWMRELAHAARGAGLYADICGLTREWEPRLARALQYWEGTLVGLPEGMGNEESLSAHAALLAGLANFAFSLGRTVEALDKMEKAQSFWRRAGNRDGAAYSLVRLALFWGPEDDRRRGALEEAAALYQSLGDQNGAAWARRNLGYQLCQQGNAREGRPLVEESLDIFRKVGNVREIAWSLNSLGQAALDEGRTADGGKALKEARDIFLGVGDWENAGWTVNRLGRAALKERRFDEAGALLEESLKLFGLIRQVRGRAQALRGLCEAFAAQGNLNNAFLVVDKAVAEAEAAGDHAGQAAALRQKGQLLAGQQRYEEALEPLKAAEEAFVRAGSSHGQALALESQALVRIAQSQLGSARGALEQACQLHAQGGSPDGEARVCVRLGDLDALEGRPRGGEGWYVRAVKVSRLGKPGDYTLGAFLGLAVLLNRQGRRLEALHLTLICERSLIEGMMAPSDPEFYAELAARCANVLNQIASKLMRSVIDEARERMGKEDARAVLKEALGRNWI
jgi:predicted ATPase/class 3 adenylate cyclase